MRRRRCGSRACEAALVNIGGDVRHAGEKPVPVAIADPFAPQDNAPPLATVQLGDQGIATSGGYRRGFQIGGRWHSHLLDPRTGCPAGEVVSASVITDSAERADVLATAFSVMRPDESLRLADSLPGVGVADRHARTAGSATVSGRTCALAKRGAPRQSTEKERKTNMGQIRGTRNLQPAGCAVPGSRRSRSPCGRGSRAGTRQSPAKPARWDDRMEMGIDFEINPPDGFRYRPPYVAVWLEDQNGNPSAP